MSREVRLRLLQHRGLWAVVSTFLVLGLAVSGLLAGSPVQAEPMSLQAATVDIKVVGIAKTIEVNDTFTLYIYIYPNGQQVDGVDADLTFDPAYLEVLSITGNSSALEFENYNVWDNTNGTLTHSRGASFTQTPPSGTFRLCSIEFKAKAATLGTKLAFTDLTGAYFQGASVLRDTIDGTVIIAGIPVGGVAYLGDRGQILAPWVVGVTMIAGLILCVAVVSRKVHRVV